MKPKFEPMPLPVDKKKLGTFLKAGGSAKTEETVEFKNFNIRMPAADLKRINDLREDMPKARGQAKPSVSLQSWILEAIYDRLEKEEGVNKVQKRKV